MSYPLFVFVLMMVNGNGPIFPSNLRERLLFTQIDQAGACFSFTGEVKAPIMVLQMGIGALD